MKKVFTLSKESIERLKNVSAVSKKTFLRRELFIVDSNKSTFIRTDIKDIPDDFSMAIFDMNSLLATYNIFKDAIIDYSVLDSKGYIKIINNNVENVSGKKEIFIYRKQEDSLMSQNLDVEKEKSVKNKIGDEHNNLTLQNETLKKIIKAGNILNANCVSFIPNNNLIDIKVFDTRIANSNAFELTVEESTVNFPKLDFDLDFQLFSIIDKSVDEYEVKFSDTVKGKNKPLITFINGDEDLIYYFSNKLKK